MALDEVLVRARTCENVLRFYHWADGPAVTFGYAQFVSQVRGETAARGFTGDICRRPTGGGVVYHTDDLTFSLIFSSQDRPGEIYEKLHGSIQAALVLCGVTARVFDQKLPAAAYAPSQQHRASTCFTNPVENDLLLPNGQKMLGGAIRRFDNRILYQGSLQVPGARTQAAYRQAVINGVRRFLDTHLQPQAAPAAWIEAAHSLAQTQYRT